MINSIYTIDAITIQCIRAEAITFKAIPSSVIPSRDNTFSLYGVELYRHRFI